MANPSCEETLSELCDRWGGSDEAKGTKEICIIEGWFICSSIGHSHSDRNTELVISECSPVICASQITVKFTTKTTPYM